MGTSRLCESSNMRRAGWRNRVSKEAWAPAAIFRFGVGCGWIEDAAGCTVGGEATKVVLDGSKKNRPEMAGMDRDGISRAGLLDDESHVVATAQEWLG